MILCPFGVPSDPPAALLDGRKNEAPTLANHSVGLISQKNTPAPTVRITSGRLPEGRKYTQGGGEEKHIPNGIAFAAATVPSINID